MAKTKDFTFELPPIRRKFEVKGETWTVKYKKVVRGDQGQELQALTDPATNTLYLTKGLPLAEQWHWFLHELNHSIWNELHLNQTEVPSGVEEIVCDGFAKVYLSLFVFGWKQRKRRARAP